jgi:hypothetical protein
MSTINPNSLNDVDSLNRTMFSVDAIRAVRFFELWGNRMHNVYGVILGQKDFTRYFKFPDINKYWDKYIVTMAGLDDSITKSVDVEEKKKYLLFIPGRNHAYKPLVVPQNELFTTKLLEPKFITFMKDVEQHYIKFDSEIDLKESSECNKAVIGVVNFFYLSSVAEVMEVR